jgi:hypothetical protein
MIRLTVTSFWRNYVTCLSVADRGAVTIAASSIANKNCSLDPWNCGRFWFLIGAASTNVLPIISPYREEKKSPNEVARVLGASSAMWCPESMRWPRRSSAQSRQITSGSP